MSNPRLQRTPLRAPLSRKPFGGARRSDRPKHSRSVFAARCTLYACVRFAASSRPV